MSRNSAEALVLAGDIGGTKTNLGLFRLEGSRPHAEILETVSSREHASLEDLIEGFIQRHSARVSAACFAIAGPVLDRRSRTTNLPWVVSEDGLKSRFSWSRVSLLNDLAATALGIPILEPDETVRLNRAQAFPGEPIGLVAPGTGLGQALLVFQGGRPVPVASEGGHADFAPTNDQEVQLWRWLARRYGHVSIERVVSGPGLEAIYGFLQHSRSREDAPWLRERLQNEDPPRVIAEIGLQGGDPLCIEALNLFCRALANVSGNLALTALTRGGLYLGGGIPPKILPKLREEGFLQTFCAKGRFRGLLESIPVQVVVNDRTALLGAAQQALSL